MKLDVLNIKGDKTGSSVELADEVFGIEPNEHAVYLAVKSLRANTHRGTHKTKERGEVKGSTKKIKRQKGTGTARAGDIKNPVFRGGGRMFGPRVHKYKSKINKKVSKLARRSVLSDYASNEKLLVVDKFELPDHKTKNYTEAIQKLGLDTMKSLVVVDQADKNLVLASRNLKTSNVQLVSQLSILDIMKAEKVVLSEESVKVLNNQLR